MSLYKRGGVWWVYLVTASGKKIRQSTKTADEAEAANIHDILKAKLITSPDSILKGNRTWREAAARWLREANKATVDKDKGLLAFYDSRIGDKKLKHITNELLQEVVSEKEPKAKPATINHYLKLARAILRKAEREWGWLDRAPAIRMRKVDNKRIRYLNRFSI